MYIRKLAMCSIQCTYEEIAPLQFARNRECAASRRSNTLIHTKVIDCTIEQDKLYILKICFEISLKRSLSLQSYNEVSLSLTYNSHCGSFNKRSGMEISRKITKIIMLCYVMRENKYSEKKIYSLKLVILNQTLRLQIIFILSL